MRHLRLALLVAVGSVVASGTASSQTPRVPNGSRYLPMDHWGYEYIGRLRDRGYLPNLNPLVQPYRRLDVARDLAVLDPDTLRQPLAEWVRLLKDELAPELDRLAGRKTRRWGVVAMAGARASTSQRLDPTRPTGSSDTWPWWRGGAWIETGPIAAETRLYGDSYFRSDPDGGDPGFDPRDYVGGMSDNAYLSVVLPFAALDVGRMVRNWGPIGTPGLMLSNVATPYPAIDLEVHVGHFAARAMAAQLDTVSGVRRHISAQELTYAKGDVAFSLGEASLYTYPSLLLRFLNPAELFFFNQSTDPPQNLMLMGQFWLRRRPVLFYLDALLDDIDVNPTTPKAEPPQYGFTLGARLVSLPPWIEPALEYQQVGAWTYRTPNYNDRYSYFNRGLGVNFSDYDRLTLRADLFPPVHGLRLTPAIVFQRQWEGNFRDSIPGGYYWGRPALAYGVAERTLRFALQGRYQPLRPLWVAWDVGPNFVNNKGHVNGVKKTELEGTVELGVRLEFP